MQAERDRRKNKRIAMDIIMGVLRFCHISKFWNSFLVKILLMKQSWKLHWYYYSDLSRNLLRRIISMPGIFFFNLIWSSLNSLKNTKLIDFCRSNLVIKYTVLSWEGICHHFLSALRSWINAASSKSLSSGLLLAKLCGDRAHEQRS